MQVDYFSKTRSMKTYRKYVRWPVGVPDKKYVVNIQTKDDCVHLSMVAYFLLQLCPEIA